MNIVHGCLKHVKEVRRKNAKENKTWYLWDLYIFWAWCWRSWKKKIQTWPSHNWLTSARPCSLWVITLLPFSWYGLSFSWRYIPISKSDYARKFKMSLAKSLPNLPQLSSQIGKSLSTWFSSQKLSFRRHNLHFKFH